MFFLNCIEKEYYYFSLYFLSCMKKDLYIMHSYYLEIHTYIYHFFFLANTTLFDDIS